MSNSAQNTVFKGYICYKVFAAPGELGDIVATNNKMRVSFASLAGRSYRQRLQLPYMGMTHH